MEKAIAVFIKIIKKLSPYIPVMSAICISNGTFHREYPASSHGNPERKKVFIYSRATHKQGIKNIFGIKPDSRT
jgi:hypothetical protein